MDRGRPNPLALDPPLSYAVTAARGLNMQKNPYKKPDRFTRAAKEAGFPARSVFKLEEIDRRARLFEPGMRVLDLGRRAGKLGAVRGAEDWAARASLLAVDLEPLAHSAAAQREFRAGRRLLARPTRCSARFAPYDVVLSDMAPSTTGNRLADQTRSFELFMRALAVAGELSERRGQRSWARSS